MMPLNARTQTVFQTVQAAKAAPLPLIKTVFGMMILKMLMRKYVKSTWKHSNSYMMPT